jgi:hypothetical protein
VIHPVGPLNRSLARIVPKDFIKAPMRALNVMLVRTDSMAMLFNKQPCLHAKIAAKEHIWINLDNQNVKTALLDNSVMWKQQYPLHHAQNAQVNHQQLSLLF